MANAGQTLLQVIGSLGPSGRQIMQQKWQQAFQQQQAAADEEQRGVENARADEVMDLNRQRFEWDKGADDRFLARAKAEYAIVDEQERKQPFDATKHGINVTENPWIGDFYRAHPNGTEDDFFRWMTDPVNTPARAAAAQASSGATLEAPTLSGPRQPAATGSPFLPQAPPTPNPNFTPWLTQGVAPLPNYDPSERRQIESPNYNPAANPPVIEQLPEMTPRYKNLDLWSAKKEAADARVEANRLRGDEKQTQASIDVLRIRSQALTAAASAFTKADKEQFNSVYLPQYNAMLREIDPSAEPMAQLPTETLGGRAQGTKEAAQKDTAAYRKSIIAYKGKEYGLDEFRAKLEAGRLAVSQKLSGIAAAREGRLAKGGSVKSDAGLKLALSTARALMDDHRKMISSLDNRLAQTEPATADYKALSNERKAAVAAYNSSVAKYNDLAAGILGGAGAGSQIESAQSQVTRKVGKNGNLAAQVRKARANGWSWDEINKGL